MDANTVNHTNPAEIDPDLENQTNPAEQRRGPIAAFFSAIAKAIKDITLTDIYDCIVGLIAFAISLFMVFAIFQFFKPYLIFIPMAIKYCLTFLAMFIKYFLILAVMIIKYYLILVVMIIKYIVIFIAMIFLAIFRAMRYLLTLVYI